MRKKPKRRSEAERRPLPSLKTMRMDQLQRSLQRAKRAVADKRRFNHLAITYFEGKRQRIEAEIARRS